MATLQSKTIFTVSEAADECGKTTGRIRQLCMAHNLGQVINTRIRLLTAADITWLKSYFVESGKNFSKIN